MHALLLSALLSQTQSPVRLETSVEFQRVHLQLEYRRLDAELNEVSYAWPNVVAGAGALWLAVGAYGVETWRGPDAVAAGVLLLGGAIQVVAGVTMFVMRRIQQGNLQIEMNEVVSRLNLLR